jgi:Cytochrome c oxidase biogenesis protein Cmc1 like
MGYTSGGQPNSQVIDALNQCHEERPIAKFWGVCTDHKLALDACFRQEKKDNRWGAVFGGSRKLKLPKPNVSHMCYSVCHRARAHHLLTRAWHHTRRRAKNFERARAERERLEARIGTGVRIPGYGVRKQQEEEQPAGV